MQNVRLYDLLYALAIACLASACSGSALMPQRAAPITLATGDENAAPEAITTFGDDVYWTDTEFGNFAPDETQGKILRVSKVGGTPEILATGQTLPWAIVADASGVYWVNLGSAAYGLLEVMALPAGSTTPIRLASVPGSTLTGLAIDADSVYWGDVAEASFTAQHENGVGRVMQVAKIGGDPVELTTVEGLAQNVAVDEQNVYWVYASAAQPALQAFAKSDGAITTLANVGNGGERGDFVLAGADFVFVSSSAGARFDQISQVPKGGGAARLLSRAGGVALIAAGDDDVCWVDVGDSAAVHIMAVPRAGGAATILASESSESFGITTSDNQVFWTAGSGAQAHVMSASSM